MANAFKAKNSSGLINVVCARLGVTKNGLARQLKINPRTLRRWLSGESNCPWAKVEAMRELCEAKREIDHAKKV